ncbi:MAG: Rieske 2Fe-2S domain-containing protein [candidate division KSB1 bacterium]
MNEASLATRREFCQQAGQAAALAIFGGALSAFLQSCSSDNPASSSGSALTRISATLSSGTITLAVDASSPLASVGSAALVQYSNSALLLARTTQDTFVAVNAICTHQNCTITNFSNSTYTCPCHGSQFNTSGQVTKGPANTSLKKYQTQFANNQLTITVT